MLNTWTQTFIYRSSYSYILCALRLDRSSRDTMLPNSSFRSIIELQRASEQYCLKDSQRAGYLQGSTPAKPQYKKRFPLYAEHPLFEITYVNYPRATMTANSPPNPPPTACKVILASAIAKSLLTEVQDGLSKLDHRPHLLGVLGNDDPSAKLYADWTA